MMLFVCGGRREVRIGVGRSCPPVRYDIVTPRHLFFSCCLSSIPDFYLINLFLNGKDVKKQCLVFHFLVLLRLFIVGGDDT